MDAFCGTNTFCLLLSIIMFGVSNTFIGLSEGLLALSSAFVAIAVSFFFYLDSLYHFFDTLVADILDLDLYFSVSFKLMLKHNNISKHYLNLRKFECCFASSIRHFNS